MPRSGLSRSAALAALPLVVAAVLLMHGLDASAGTPGTPVATGTSAVVEHHHDAGTDPHGSCASCPGPHHLVMVCVAVVATIGTCRAARHLSTSARGAIPAVRTLATRVRGLLIHAVPPSPVWVRLSVMRC